jgi:TonB family protein
MHRYFALILLITGASQSFAKRYTMTELWEMFIRHPLPQHVYGVEHRFLYGRGEFRLFVDERGKVRSVRTLQSTRHPELDASVVEAFMQWKARPGPRREVDVRIVFAQPGGRVDFP